MDSKLSVGIVVVSALICAVVAQDICYLHEASTAGCRRCCVQYGRRVQDPLYTIMRNNVTNFDGDKQTPKNNWFMSAHVNGATSGRNQRASSRVSKPAKCACGTRIIRGKCHSENSAQECEQCCRGFNAWHVSFVPNGYCTCLAKDFTQIFERAPVVLTDHRSEDYSRMYLEKLNLVR